MADPLSRGSVALWLKPSDTSTISHTGGLVDTLNDKSSLGRNFTGSGTARPVTGTRAVNGKNGLDFDGVNDALIGPTINITAPYTLAGCWYLDNGANSLREIMVADGLYVVEKESDNTFNMYGGNVIANSTVGAAGVYYFVAVVDSSAGYLMVNAATPTVGNSGAGAWGNGATTIGVRGTTESPTNGIFLETVIYTDPLNSTDRAALNAYFVAEYITPSGVARAMAGKADAASSALQRSVTGFR